MRADKQTDGQTHSSQYSAPVPGESNEHSERSASAIQYCVLLVIPPSVTDLFSSQKKMERKTQHGTILQVSNLLYCNDFVNVLNSM